MKTILSFGDLVDTYFKIRTVGLKNILPRLTSSSKKTRVTKAWDNTLSVSNIHWWSIPLVQKRWNEIITGSGSIEYPEYLLKKYFDNRFNLNLLSPGCGTGGKELKYAKFKNFNLIEAFDLAPKRVEVASENVKKLEYNNVFYSVSDALNFNYGNNKYDVIVFDSFLHHIKNLGEVLDKICISLKSDGIFVINEYVGPNRFQWSNEQIKVSNSALKELPPSFRTRWQTGDIKIKIYRPGFLRMILSDPSEAVNSENILPEIKKRFKTLEEKPFGGNILHLTLKDISHNFATDSNDVKQILKNLFEIEDEFLSSGNRSDFVFGVYSKQ